MQPKILNISYMINDFQNRVKKNSIYQMQPGTFELLILVFIFLGLQAWWIFPIINKNNKLNKRGKDLRDEINQLEKLYKK